MKNFPAKHFYMIRHGETEANAAQIMAGHTDSPLTKKGRAQARTAQDVVESLDIKPVAIFHSHLRRARDTATIINHSLNLPIFEDPDLSEINAGELEGAPYEDCKHLFDGWSKTREGESPNDFFQRVKRGKTRALRTFNEPVLIVCHGGVMRAFGALYDQHPPSKFKNAHLYEFTPCQENTHFPWTVSDYERCEKSGQLIKTRSKIYTS